MVWRRRVIRTRSSLRRRRPAAAGPVPACGSRGAARWCRLARCGGEHVFLGQAAVLAGALDRRGSTPCSSTARRTDGRQRGRDRRRRRRPARRPGGRRGGLGLCRPRCDPRPRASRRQRRRRRPRSCAITRADLRRCRRRRPRAGPSRRRPATGTSTATLSVSRLAIGSSSCDRVAGLLEPLAERRLGDRFTRAWGPLTSVAMDRSLSSSACGGFRRGPSGRARRRPAPPVRPAWRLARPVAGEPRRRGRRSARA